MKSLLIRAEDKNIWERRSTIVPHDLAEIMKQVPIKAFIETSQKRFFSADEFQAAGASPCSGMESGDVIFGVKEIPEEKILKDKVYLYFSHTIKGQSENMSMLKRIMDSGSTLIDYEKITDAEGRRKVFFGPYAGDAGAIDILWLLGEAWQEQGLKTIFSEVRQALNYESVADAREKLRRVGRKLSEQPFPGEIGPVVFAVLGYGNVSKGAQQILQCFPHEYIEPEALAEFYEAGTARNDRIYICVFKEQHLAERRDGVDFDLQDYYSHPEQYRGSFEPFLKYITVLINATYWEKRYPKFVTWDALQRLSANGAALKLRAIADITCDVNGSVECNVKSTDSGMPAYRVLPEKRMTEDGHIGPGIVLLAVDNLPAELPKDASEFFSKHLKPYVPGIMQADYSRPLEESGLPEEIKRAVIVYNGKLTPGFQYLQEFLPSH